VEERLDAYLVLGCNGHITKGSFVHCSGVENPIFNILDADDNNYPGLVDFLDSACGLFDSPTNDYNKCMNIITMLRSNYGIINDEVLHNIQFFIKNHKQCGIYIYLIMKEDFEND
jgi:hypothetical protein